MVSDRLQRFMTTNNYIKRNIQKGFLSGVAGCVDHTFMLGEALQERIRDKLAFVVSWIDLENAYGSVAHNLIQFALNWYHVNSSAEPGVSCSRLSIRSTRFMTLAFALRESSFAVLSQP